MRTARHVSAGRPSSASQVGVPDRPQRPHSAPVSISLSSQYRRDQSACAAGPSSSAASSSRPQHSRSKRSNGRMTTNPLRFFRRTNNNNNCESARARISASLTQPASSSWVKRASSGCRCRALRAARRRGSAARRSRCSKRCRRRSGPGRRGRPRRAGPVSSSPPRRTRPGRTTCGCTPAGPGTGPSTQLAADVAVETDPVHVGQDLEDQRRRIGHVGDGVRLARDEALERGREVAVHGPGVRRRDPEVVHQSSSTLPRALLDRAALLLLLDALGLRGPARPRRLAHARGDMGRGDHFRQTAARIGAVRVLRAEAPAR